jgi:hypothetical protein
MEQVEVWRGKYGDPVPPVGPLPGMRSGRALAYEMVLPDRLSRGPGVPDSSGSSSSSTSV